MIGLILTMICICRTKDLYNKLRSRRPYGIVSPIERTCNELKSSGSDLERTKYWAQCCIYLHVHVKQLPKCYKGLQQASSQGLSIAHGIDGAESLPGVCEFSPPKENKRLQLLSSLFWLDPAIVWRL